MKIRRLDKGIYIMGFKYRCVILKLNRNISHHIHIDINGNINSDFLGIVAYKHLSFDKILDNPHHV